MRDKKRQVKLILLLVLLLVAVIFVVLNTDPVAINFGLFNIKLPLIIVLVGMLIIGVLIGWFLGSNSQDKSKKN